MPKMRLSESEVKVTAHYVGNREPGEVRVDLQYEASEASI